MLEVAFLADLLLRFFSFFLFSTGFDSEVEELEAARVVRRSRDGGSGNEGGEVGLPEEDRMLELTTDCDLPLLELFELAELETVDGLRLALEVETDLVGVEVAVNSLRPLMLGLGTAMAAPEFFLGSLETGLYDSGLEGMIMVLGVVAFFGFDPAEEDEKVRTRRAVARKDLELQIGK